MPMDSLGETVTRRRLLGVALVGLCVLSAGCMGVFGGETANGTVPPGNGTAMPTASETPVASDDTATSESPAGTESGSDGHAGHSHTHGSGTETDDSGNAPPASGTSGKMTVAVNGTELDLQALDTPNGFDVNASDEHTWVAANESFTLTQSLSTFGIEATAEELTYDGTTYTESAEGTVLSYRVNGQAVDPTEYRLSNGDQVWVTVETDEMNVSTPGTYIRAAQQHIHGSMNVTVDGQTIDFSNEKFQSNHRHFHFEGGHGEKWHAHSYSVTLEYGLSTLTDVDADADTFTSNGTTYSASNDGTTITYRVNGEAVDPGEYYLKDGDSVQVLVERDG